MSHKVKVDNGKYEFVMVDGWDLKVLRHGEPWIAQIEGSKAIHSLMAELDAARVVLKTVRDFITDRKQVGDSSYPVNTFEDALKIHDGLVYDHELPSPWARP